MPPRLFARHLAAAALALAGLAAPAFAETATPRPPPTPQRPVSDTYHGVTVVDPYRWMEATGSDEYRGWITAQAAHARRALDALPGRAALAARVQALAQAGPGVSGLAWGGGKLFYLATEPGRGGARLMVRDDERSAPRLLLDPAQLSQPGQRMALGDFTPSRDGRHVAVNIAANGGEQSVLVVVEVATGRLLDERIDRVYGGSWTVSWLDDGEHFFYVRSAGTGDARDDSRIHLHRLGRPLAGDPAVFGPGVQPGLDFAPSDYSYLLLSPGGAHVVAVTVPGVANERHFHTARLADVLAGRATWRRLARPADQWFRGYLAGAQLYVMSREAAPGRKLLRLDLERPDAAPALVLPPAAWQLDDAAVARDGLYVKATEVGVSRLLRVPFGGGAPQPVPLPVAGATVRELAARPGADGLLAKLEGWADPGRVWALGAGSARDTGLLPPPAADFSTIESEMVFVPGHDSTRIPLTLVRPRGLPRDGLRPTVLTGYGAYGVTREPRFDATHLAWLERGGLLAVCHVRGGGEYGAEWHAAGRVLTKSNTLRDLVACAEALVAPGGYTRPAKLALHGVSAGGLAVGGALTERPALFAAVHHEVGLADLLRTETTSNGRANIPEFGTVADRYQFLAMHAVSPLHRVADGVAYPAVLVSTGIHDVRVSSWEPAKFAARLQAASASGRPVLLRVDMDAGHGPGSTAAQRAEKIADAWAFFLDAMGEGGGPAR